MGAFRTVASAYTTLAETLNDIGNGVRGCVADGAGAAVDTWNESMSAAADEVAKLADTAMTTSTTCEAQDAADSAMQGADPTPAVVAEARDRYAADPTPENRQTLADLMQQRADALDAHTAATEQTNFPEVPGSSGGGDGAGTGAGPHKPKSEGDWNGPGDEEEPEGTDSASDAPTPSAAPSQPNGTSPSSSTPTPHTTVSDTAANTGLSGDNSATPQTSALSGATGHQPAAPGQGIGGGQVQGANTVPAGSYQLSPTANAAPTRKQRQEQERDQKVADTAAATAAAASLAFPDAVANAQSHFVPGTANTSTSVSGSDAKLGTTPSTATQSGAAQHPPGSGPIGPAQTAAMGSGARAMRYRPPPPPPPPVDMEKVIEQEERRAAERKLADAWK